MRWVENPTLALVIAFVFAIAAVAVVLLSLGGWLSWESAEVMVSVLGVWAAVIAIYAAYLEVQTLFPKQKIGVEVLKLNEDATQVLLTNEGPLVVSSQFDVTLLDEEREYISTFSFSPSEQGEWTPHYLPSEPGEFTYTWTRVSTTPFFPRTSIAAPSAPSRRGMWWRVRWYTDRSSGVEEIKVP